MCDSRRASQLGRLTFPFVFATLVAGSLLGCERPFIEPREPEIEVISPDLSVVQPQREILLEIRASSQNSVDSVLLNGIPLQPGSDEGMFSTQLRLNFGLTTLIVEAFDLTGTSSRDTLYAVALPSEGSVGDLTLPDPRGGHTATRLENGSFMVAGGVPQLGMPATNTAWIYSFENLRQPPEELHMLDGRTEHTATPLPDGRILFIGGSSIFEPQTVSELVEDVELFDPNSAQFVPVPISGDPVRRAGHTTILFQVGRRGSTDLFLYLYGGRGDVQYRPQSRMGIRGDLRVFQFRNDSLVAVGPTIGPFVDAIEDHTWTPTQPQFGNEGVYLVSGSLYAGEDLFDDVVFQATLSTTSGALLESTGRIQVHRSGHAAARLVDGEVLILGGRAFALNSAFRSVEVYYSRIRQFYSMPVEQGMLQKRWGHTATKWDTDRILIVGGFSETGAALTTSEWYTIKRTD